MALFKEPRIISIVMNKGGVGKTTCTANLLAALTTLGRQGRKGKEYPTCLGIDLDPQCNLTTVLGPRQKIQEAKEQEWREEALEKGEDPESYSSKKRLLTVADYFDPAFFKFDSEYFIHDIPRPFFKGRGKILMSHSNLGSIEGRWDFRFKLAARFAAGLPYEIDPFTDDPGPDYDEALYEELKQELYQGLRERLKKQFAGKVDYIVIDTPPSLGILTQIGLSVSDYVLPTICPGGRELDGLRAIEDTVGRIWKNYNSRLKVVGVLVNELFSKQVLSSSVVEHLEGQYQNNGLLLDSYIPRATSLGVASSEMRTVFEDDDQASRKIQKDFVDVIREISDRVFSNSGTGRAVSGEQFYEESESREQDPVVLSMLRAGNG